MKNDAKTRCDAVYIHKDNGEKLLLGYKGMACGMPALIYMKNGKTIGYITIAELIKEFCNCELKIFYKDKEEKPEN